MKHFRLATMATFAALLAGCATPDQGSTDGVGLEREEVFIPFANQRSAVTSWQADGREGIWIESGRGNWYYASFFNTCLGLDSAVRVGFDTGTTNRIDRFSHVIVPNQRDRCAIKSLTASDAPPDGDRRTLDGEVVK